MIIEVKAHNQCTLKIRNHEIDLTNGEVAALINVLKGAAVGMFQVSVDAAAKRRATGEEEDGA